MKIWSYLKDWTHWEKPFHILALTMIPAALLGLALVFDRLTPRVEVQESLPSESSLVETEAETTEAPTIPDPDARNSGFR